MKWFASFILVVFVSLSVRTDALSPAGTARLEKARELVSKGERVAAVKILKEEKLSGDTAVDFTQAWQAIAEIFLTDKAQNQFSLAESIWLVKPKEALDLLTPLLKSEDANLQVSRLAARSALRILDCVRADSFVKQAELVFPIGPEVRLLALQVQDCSNGVNAQAPPLRLSPENEPLEIEGSVRLLAVKDALRKKDFKAARAALTAWENSRAKPTDNPEFWYWRWRTSSVAGPGEAHDRISARKYLSLCSELTPRGRKNLATYPDLCANTETVESDLKSSDKAGT